MSSNKKDLTQGNVLKTLIYFSMPYLLSCFMQTFYGMMDLYVVGKFNSSSTVSAVAICSQVMHMFTVIILGFAMGSTVKIAQAIGNKDDKKAAQAIGNSTVMFTCFAILFTVILLIFTSDVGYHISYVNANGSSSGNHSIFNDLLYWDSIYNCI